MKDFLENNYQWLLSGIIPTTIAVIVSVLIYKKGQMKKNRKKPKINGENTLSKIRKKVLSAKTLKELKEAKFELEEYKAIFPFNFEVSELEELIKQSIHYETTQVQNKEKYYCYVATCIYGSYDCPQVWTLRRYRDYSLAKKWYGRVFIRTYYFLSPEFVKMFGKTKLFTVLFKKILDKFIVKLQHNGFENTPI